MRAKHSPGPWSYSVERQLDPKYMDGCVRDSKGDDVCWLYVGVVTSDVTENEEANARLIAAAPEMLALLREALPLARALRKSYSEPGFDDRSELCKSLEALLARLDG